MKRVCFFAAVLLGLPGPVFAGYAGLANTPPMGYNNWNAIGTVNSQAIMQAQADAITTTGLSALGYGVKGAVEVDDGWALTRTAAGVLTSTTATWPSMPGFAAYCHAAGLNAGIYTSASTTTCAGHPGSGAAFWSTTLDAQTFATWGFDDVKDDACNASAWAGIQSNYLAMAAALTATGRPMLLRLCYLSGFPPNVFINPGASNTFRSSGDIGNTFGQVISNFQACVTYYTQSGPGNWADADLLEIGNGVLTVPQEQFELSSLAMCASPLMISTDLRTIAAQDLTVLKNSDVIAVDQDKLGVPCWAGRGWAAGVTSYARPLSGNGIGTHWSVGVFNSTAVTVTGSVQFSDYGLTGTVTVYDNWAHSTVQNTPGMTSYTASVGPFSVLHVNLTGSHIQSIAHSFISSSFLTQAVTQNLTAGASATAGWVAITLTAGAPNTQVMPLVETSGYYDGGSLSITCGSGVFYNTPSPSYTDGNQYLFNAWADAFGGVSNTVNITGIPATFLPATGYYYFNDASANRGQYVTINGVTSTVLTLGAYSGTLTAATCTAGCSGNYLTFPVTTTAVTIITTPSSGGTLRAPFNAFQIVSNALQTTQTAASLSNPMIDLRYPWSGSGITNFQLLFRK